MTVSSDLMENHPHRHNIINLNCSAETRSITDILDQYQDDLILVYIYSLNCLSHHDFQQQQVIDLCQHYSRVWLIYLNLDTNTIPSDWIISSYPILLLIYQQQVIRHIIPTHPNLGILLVQYYQQYIMREGLHHHPISYRNDRGSQLNGTI